MTKNNWKKKKFIGCVLADQMQFLIGTQIARRINFYMSLK